MASSIQAIHWWPTESGPVYRVTLDDGSEVLCGEQQLASYAAFQRRTATRGVYFICGDLMVGKAVSRQATWCKMVANGVQAGGQIEPPQRRTVSRPR